MSKANKLQFTGSKRESAKNGLKIGQVVPLDEGLLNAKRVGIDPNCASQDARLSAQYLLDQSLRSEPLNNWLLLRFDIAKTGYLNDLFRSFGFEVWHPQASKMVKVRKAKRRFREVFFDVVPGYMFVRVGEVKKAGMALVNVRGVDQVICSDGSPLPIPNNIIDLWKKGLKDVSAQNNAQKNIADDWVGKNVHVKDGQYAYFQGVVKEFIESRNAVSVDVKLLGGTVKAEISLAIVEK